MTDETRQQFVATFTFGYQNGPETMAFEPRHLIVTEGTTVGEIIAWYREHIPIVGVSKFAVAGPITIQEATR